LKEASRLNKITAQIKASQIVLRNYLYSIVGFIVISFLVNFIIALFVDSSDNTQVSPANMLVIFLIFVGIVIPVSSFRRMMNLGATRKEYYIGSMSFYILWAAVIALINVIWQPLEREYIIPHYPTFNILEIFQWDQFNYLGSFLYQFVIYLTLITLFNLLFSSLRHYLGWVIWLIFLAGIPVSMSIAALRHKVSAGFSDLLINDSLLQGLALNLGFVIVFILAGWWFTSKRTF
jgi:hypothetical protein